VHPLSSIARSKTCPSAEDLAWLGVGVGVLLVLAAFKWVAPAIDSALAPPGGYDVFPGAAGLFAPEPLEEARFLIAIAAAVVLAAGVVRFGSDRVADRRLDLPVIGIQLAVFVFIAWSATRQDRDLLFATDLVATRDYLPSLLLGGWVVIAGVVIGLTLMAAVLWAPRPGWSGRLPRCLTAPWLPGGIAIGATVLWLLAAVVTDANIAGAGLLGGHIPLQLEDYAAAVNGRTPLVDYVAWYSSLLPIALAPVLGAFDSSVTAFSLIECTVNLAALMCVYLAFVHVTGRRWAALALYVPFVAFSFTPWHTGPDGLWTQNGLYYAAFPARYLGPFIVLWLLARRLRRGSPPLWVIYLASGLCVLNDFDFGACVLLALIVTSLIEVVRSRERQSTAGEHLYDGSLGLVGALLIVCAVTLIRAGDLPDPAILTYWTTTFGRQGFGLIAMPWSGLHWALYFTYAAALVTAAVRLVRSPDDATMTSMLAFTGVFGLTTGQYFAGRSEGTQLMVLFPIWGLTLALLAWLVVTGLRGASPRSAPRTVLPATAVMVGFGVMVAAIANVPRPWQQIDRIGRNGAHPLELAAEQQFVERSTRAGEPILLVTTPLDHRVAERAGVRNVSPWGTNAFFSPSEVDRALHELDDADGTKLFENFGISGVGPDVHAMLRDRGFVLVSTDLASKLSLWERSGSG
jgi:hypothetical protein